MARQPGIGRFLPTSLQGIALARPIYVCGLARSGSTLLHEILASHRGVATHRIKDFPLLFTPVWWRRATASMRQTAPRERAHRDGIMITPESPDSIEEMLWTTFFPRCHDPSVDNRLKFDHRNPAFEKFYRNHIRKLLLAENATRYVSKANYHVARLEYLLRMFKDARFIVPVREPAGHIASSMRQHRWFSAGQRSQARSLAYMQRSGHFEFGLDRRPINLGDDAQVRAILDCWTGGEELLGWARYWNMVHGYLANLLDSDSRIRDATLVVRFEAMCRNPGETIHSILKHCELPDREEMVARFERTIRLPRHEEAFSVEEQSLIRGETVVTARRFGFDP